MAHNSVEVGISLKQTQDILGRVERDAEFGEWGGHAKRRDVACIEWTVRDSFRSG